MYAYVYSAPCIAKVFSLVLFSSLYYVGEDLSSFSCTFFKLNISLVSNIYIKIKNKKD